jgi:predicted regulator of Ras-like GTPase activity (Roadblock/LC7/MglB family)
MREADGAQIQTALERLLGDAGGAAALLIDRGGDCLASSGAVAATDLTAVAALAASTLGAGVSLARLLGEAEFSVLSLEGAAVGVHLSAVDERAILLVIFDERTTVGMVRVFAREATTRIAAIRAEARHAMRRRPA